jgi:hypothetical protein
MGGVKEKFSNWYYHPLFIVFNLMHVRELKLFLFFFFECPGQWTKAMCEIKIGPMLGKDKGFSALSSLFHAFT